MFQRTSDINQYATRQHQSFVIHLVKTIRSQKTIKITGPKLWNNLIKVINVHCKISSCKTNLKKYILSSNNLSVVCYGYLILPLIILL